MLELECLTDELSLNISESECPPSCFPDGFCAPERSRCVPAEWQNIQSQNEKNTAILL